MRLKRLKIGNDSLENGYKNFKNTEISFYDDYSVFIGLNGSGKSNLLEAISKIFKSLYFIDSTRERVNFDFELEYSIAKSGVTYDIEIKFLSNRFSFKANPGGRINQGEYKDYLPEQIIANYSGEELRLWDEVYFKFYERYTSQVRNLQPLQDMNMIYLNKYNWAIALINLLSLEDEIILDMLGLENINSVDVIFSFDTSKYTTYEENKVIELIDFINPNRIESTSMDLVSIKSTNILDEENITDEQKYINLFNLLYVASMPKQNKIITFIDIKFGEYGLKSLSEGEKKMILMRFIYHFSANKESLILLDEPDTHIHISRKKDLVNMITKRGTYYSVVTTHSPVLVSHFDEEHISILIPDETNGIKTENADKFKQIETLSEDTISLLDTSLIISTKKLILMVEGINDINYIKKALEVLNRIQDNKYQKLEDIITINCGGADNVKPVFEEIVKPYLKSEQICLIIFDDDNTGRKNKDKIQKIINDENLENVKTFTHPKIDDSQNGDFYMEDYFSIEAYKPLLEDKIRNSNSFKSLDSLEKAKTIINNNYLKEDVFKDEHFTNFSVLFDKLINEFGFED